MINVELVAPNGNVFRLDTYDMALVGIWLKNIFDTVKPSGSPVPAEFRLTIRGM